MCVRGVLNSAWEVCGEPLTCPGRAPPQGWPPDVQGKKTAALWKVSVAALQMDERTNGCLPAQCERAIGQKLLLLGVEARSTVDRIFGLISTEQVGTGCNRTGAWMSICVPLYLIGEPGMRGASKAEFVSLKIWMETQSQNRARSKLASADWKRLIWSRALATHVNKRACTRGLCTGVFFSWRAADVAGLSCVWVDSN